MNARTFLFSGLLFAAAVLGGCQQQESAAPQAQASADNVVLPAGCLVGENTAIGGPFDLIDQTGRAVTQQSFQEGPTLIYFGYTYCPDICPLALQSEKATLAALGQQGQVIQPVLISVDPTRDTAAAMDSYVKSSVFPEGLLGLTGSEAQVVAAAKAFRVSWQKESDPQSAGAYTVSHTSFFYLMDENWRLAAMYPSTLKPAEAAICLKAGLKKSESQAEAP
jgi:protein SCO1/2